VVDNLFGEMNPVGQVIRINKATFRVVGVLAPKGQSAGGQDQDDSIIVPLTTAQERMLGITYVQAINVQAENAEVINQVQEDIGVLLRSRHRLQPRVTDDFTVRNLTALMATATGNHRHHHPAARQYGGDFASGRRHRDHEHYAGVSHGENTGNRRA